jgi:hypothetical protein
METLATAILRNAAGDAKDVDVFRRAPFTDDRLHRRLVFHTPTAAGQPPARCHAPWRVSSIPVGRISHEEEIEAQRVPRWSPRNRGLFD